MIGGLVRIPVGVIRCKTVDNAWHWRASSGKASQSCEVLLKLPNRWTSRHENASVKNVTAHTLVNMGGVKTIE